VVTWSLALFLLILGLIRGNPDGWGSPRILAALFGSAVLMAIFLAIERRSSHPMLELPLFRKPAFNGVSAVAFALSASMFAMFLYITIYIQGVLGFSPLEAGVRFLPLTLLSFCVAPISAKLSERVPIRFLVGVGLTLVGIGLALMHGMEPDSKWTELLPGFLAAGAGIGITNPGIGQAAIAVVPAAKAGMASGINTTFRQTGIATGVAALGAVFQSRIDSELGKLLPQAKPGLSDVVASGGAEAAARVVPPGTRAQVTEAATTAFTSALNEILLIASVIAFVGAVLGVALVRAQDFVPQGPQQEPEAAPVAA
jgi:predicted MFS family arabinose efflux permease